MGGATAECTELPVPRLIPIWYLGGTSKCCYFCCHRKTENFDDFTSFAHWIQYISCFFLSSCHNRFSTDKLWKLLHQIYQCASLFTSVASNNTMEIETRCYDGPKKSGYETDKRYMVKRVRTGHDETKIHILIKACVSGWLYANRRVSWYRYADRCQNCTQVIVWMLVREGTGLYAWLHD